MVSYSAIAFTSSWWKDNSQTLVVDVGLGHCHQLVKIGATVSVGDINTFLVLYRG